MYMRGDCRSETLPCARRSRSRCRIFSRSSATAFMRLFSVSGTSSGMASVSTVAPAATAANTMVRTCGSSSCCKMEPIAAALEIEVDHLAHHQNADAHPGRAAGQHHAAELLGPKERSEERRVGKECRS